MKAILIMGSTADEPHAKKITDKLDDFEQTGHLLSFTDGYIDLRDIQPGVRPTLLPHDPSNFITMTVGYSTPLDLEMVLTGQSSRPWLARKICTAVMVVLVPMSRMIVTSPVSSLSLLATLTIFCWCLTRI